MKYLLLIYNDEQRWNEKTQADREDVYYEYRKLMSELQTKGQFLGGSELEPINTARSVRVREGKPLMTDGPFAETREQLGGYFLIEVANIDEATAIAARIPSARTGTIEVRALSETRSD